MDLALQFTDIATEVRYWTRIMQEHSLFLRIGMPNDRPDLIMEAQQLYERFTDLRQVVERSLNEQNWRMVLTELQVATEALLAFKRRILNLALQCQLTGGQNYPLLVDHIAREAQEFLSILAGFLMNPDGLCLEWALGQEVFWLRIMADHSLFILHLLDPSERTLTLQAQEFADLFYRLLLQAMDLQSMLQANPQRFPAVQRFTDEVIARTTDLRNFKQAAFELLSRCQILSIAPPLLADHVRREADHFLEILARIQMCLT